MVFEPTEETSSRFFPNPLHLASLVKNRKYILVPTRDSFLQRIYFLFTEEGRGDNSLNQERNANASFFLSFLK